MNDVVFRDAELSLRACEHCLSHLVVDGVLYCRDQTVRGQAPMVPCARARDRNGLCGWDASCLDWPKIGCRPGQAAPLRAI